MKLVNQSDQRKPSKSFRLFFVTNLLAEYNLAVVTAFSALLLMFRATMGVDLSDEAYYATFIDGWLKNGVRHNSNLMIHQTAAILVYPFALIYTYLRGTEDGLILFLRFVYITIASLSATCVYRLVFLHRGPLVASLTTVFAIFFIPFGLPAPSYNTISMFFMMAALSLFAIPFCSSSDLPIKYVRRFLPKALWLSAFLWTPACLAYPPLLIPLIALLFLAPILTRSIGERQMIRNYIISCTVILFTGVLIVIIILGPIHLLDSMRFTNAAASVSDGFTRKLVATYDLFIHFRRFTELTVLALLIAVYRAFTPYSRVNWLGVTAFGVLIIGLITSGRSALYIFSHDLVFLLAITGTGIAFRYFRDRNKNNGIGSIGVIYFVSLFGGLVTSATSYNGIGNFPVGCFLAACLSLSMLGPSIEKIKINGLNTFIVRIKADEKLPLYLLVSLSACCIVGGTSLNFYYGQNEKISFRNSVLITSGVFEGLRTDSNMALYVERMTTEINNQNYCGNKILVMGNGPSFYLMTPMIPRTLTTFSITMNSNKNFATDAETTFFSAQENRPDVIVVNKAAPLSKSDIDLIRHYTFTQDVAIGSNSSQIYVRTSCLSSD